MTHGKKILVGVIAIVALLAIYGYKKATDLAAVFGKITIKPNSLPKAIKINLDTFSFTIDILMVNPSVDDFAVTGYIATLTKVKVFYKQKYLGEAAVNIYEISVPGKGQLVLHDIPVVLPIDNILSNATDFLNLNMNDLTFTGIIDVAGNEFEIGA
jgi:hypothetical protein